MGYLDNSGLWIPTGLEQTVPSISGEYKTYGALREIEVKLDLTKLTTTNTVFDYNAFFPKGVVIEKVVVMVDAAAVGGTSVNVGMIGTDHSTAADATGILNGVLTAALTIGTEIVLTKGSTGAGTKVGANPGLTVPTLICAAAAGTFSAGFIRVRVSYYRP
jgi:hypothetical protein